MNNLEMIQTLVEITPQTISNALEIETNDVWACVQYPNFTNPNYWVDLVSKRTLIESSYEASNMAHALDWLAGMVRALRTGDFDGPAEPWEYN